MPHEQRSEEVRELAEKVVKLLMEDDELAQEFGERLLVLGKQKCPGKKHNCVSPFNCNVPFNCPKLHTISKPPASIELE